MDLVGSSQVQWVNNYYRKSYQRELTDRPTDRHHLTGAYGAESFLVSVLTVKGASVDSAAAATR